MRIATSVKLIGIIAALLTVGVACAGEEGSTRTGNTESAREFDVLLRGGHVIEGSGSPAFRADVGIRDGRVAAIGQLEQRAARRLVDVSGLLVTPGFIDLHSHANEGLVSADPVRRSAPNLVTQGITTVVVNQDGGGPLPIKQQRLDMERLGIGPNVVQMIGHGTVRRSVMKDDYRRAAAPSEIEEMRLLVRAGMQAGARGLSAGLEYVPGRWSTVGELETLVRELAAFRGVYIVHERSSGSRPMWYLPSRDNPAQPSMIDNMQELIDIGSATGVTVVATHIKARGVDFWGSSRLMIQMIEQARQRGVKIFADQYPYNTSGSDGRIVLIPAWLNERLVEAKLKPRSRQLTPAESLELVLGDETLAAHLRRDIEYEIQRRGGSDQIVVVQHPNAELVGKTLTALVESLACSDVEGAIQLQLQGDRQRPGGARLRAFSMSEPDVEAFAARPWTATSSDAGIALPEDGLVHPRFYGAFARKIRHYAIDRKVISVEAAVRAATSLPADILGLADRGRLQPGAHGDIVVFDPLRIRDKADAFHPHRFCEGIPYVLVGGEFVVDQEKATGRLVGSVLKRNRKN